MLQLIYLTCNSVHVLNMPQDRLLKLLSKECTYFQFQCTLPKCPQLTFSSVIFQHCPFPTPFQALDINNLFIFATLLDILNSDVILIFMSLISSKAKWLSMFISIFISSFLLQLGPLLIFLFEHVSSFYFNQFVRNVLYMLQIFFPKTVFL